VTRHEREAQAITWAQDGSVTAWQTWEAVDDDPVIDAAAAPAQWALPEAERRAAIQRWQRFIVWMAAAVWVSGIAGLVGIVEAFTR
jgi:hypothetical protein